MTPERERLTAAIAERAVQLRLKLSQVAKRADMSAANFLRIRTGEVAVTPLAAAALDHALEWEAGSVLAILSGNDPTPRRQTPDEPSASPADARAAGDAGSPAGLPQRIRFALGDGEIYETDLMEVAVPGGKFPVIVVAQVGEFDTEEGREAGRMRAAAWDRIEKGFRRVVEEVTEELGDAADDAS